jgi:hypothetical protein
MHSAPNIAGSLDEALPGMKTVWMDRWRLGLFGQDRIKTFKGQLSDCKSTLSMALSTISGYVSFPMEWKYAVVMLVQLAYAH